MPNALFRYSGILDEDRNSMPQGHPEEKNIISSLLTRETDFPAMSQTIGLINQLTASEDTPVTELANIILKDYALTHKVLKLVNTVTFAQYGEITTISRAVTVMGYENIRSIALTLKLFEDLQKNANTSELKDMVARSLYSAVLASDIAASLDLANKEEAFICGLFHEFGNLAVAFSYPEKNNEIMKLIGSEGMKEAEAARAVLGVSFEDIGTGLAQAWNFPQKIVNSMHKIHASEMKGRLNELDSLRGLANISNEISNILATTAEKGEKDLEIRRLVSSFKGSFSHLDEVINGSISSSLEVMKEFSAVFGMKLRGSNFVKHVKDWTSDAESVAHSGKQDTSPHALKPPSVRDTEGGGQHVEKDRQLPQGKTFQPDDRLVSAAEADAIRIFDSIQGIEEEETPEVLFTRGIQEVTSALFQKYDLNDTLRIILETIYRATKLLGVTRIVFLIKDTVTPTMKIRFGFGNEIEGVKKWFAIPLDNSIDIFNLSFSRQKDLIIKDTAAPEISKLLPDWYKRNVSPEIFFFSLPIVIQNKPIAMIYGEGPKGAFHRLSGAHVNYLKILRDQAILTIKQKRGSG